jgi:hypothetical protein
MKSFRLQSQTSLGIFGLMSLSSIGQSIPSGISPTPSHQAIGRNGSFWLPQQIDQSFDSKVKKSAPSKEGAKQGAAKGEGTGKSNSGGKSPISDSTPGSRAKAAGNTRSTGKSSTTQPLASSKFGTTSVKTPQLQKLAPHSPLPGRSVGAEQVLHGNQPKPQRNANRSTAQFEANARESISPDPERRGNGEKHGGRRGTKNALIDSKMDIVQSQQDFKVLEGQTSRDPATSVPPQARAFLKFLANSVAPRMAYLDKNTRKVVRFAVDLPNKAKLGVRIEESGNSLSICFICSDKESMEMLGFTKNALAESLGDQSGKTAQVNVFTNYKEMDEHFSRAA